MPDVLRVNPKFLDNIKGLSDDLVDQLGRDIANPKYNLAELFDESPDDVLNVWKRLKEDPYWAQDFAKETSDSRWLKWKDREFFKEVTALGRKFESDYLLPRFKNRNSPEYLQLKNKANTEFGVDLNEYDMYSQVQLRYNGSDYFVADQVYVKWSPNPVTGIDEVQDIVVIENKLKSTTSLTINQNAGKAASKLDVRSINPVNQSPVSENPLPKDTSIPINDKWLKVYDSDTGDTISGIEKL